MGKLNFNFASKFESLSLLILLIMIIISPLLFISTKIALFDTFKNFIIIGLSLVSLISYSLALLKKRPIILPKNGIIITGIAILISTFISSLLSTNIQKSLFGQGFETNTFSFLFIMIAISFLIIQLFYNNKNKIYLVINSLFFVFIFLSVFHIIRFIDPTLLVFGIFNSPISSIIGRWNDFGVFSAIIFLISFFSLVLRNNKSINKVLIYTSMLLSLFFIIAVNSVQLWFVLGIIMALFISILFKRGIVSNKTIYSVIFLIIFSVLSIWGRDINSSIIKKLNIDQADISLPWQLALDITTDTIKEKPLFGAGPNRFTNEFLLHKPLILNSSPYWSVEFNNGIGYIPNYFVTNGIFGIALCILFIIQFINLGIKYFRKNDTELELYSTISFIIPTCLWLILCLYNPSHYILLITFIFTGLFISIISTEGFIKNSEIKLNNKILFILLAIVFLFFSVIYIKKTIALSYFQSGISQLNTNNNISLDSIENKFKDSLFFDKSDIYYQALSEMTIIKINNLIKKVQDQNIKNIDQETVKSIAGLIDTAITYSKKAIEMDSTNYYNYVSAARVYELASSLQIPNAYENAKNSYTSAINLNPLNPSLYLNLARLEVQKNNLAEAQKYIGLALQLKQNYIDAIFLLSQIQVSLNQVNEAITSVQLATQINPNDPLLFFQLGLLQYNNKNYKSSIESLTKALSLNNQYANAKYFLGLSYSRLNNYPEAIKQFEELAKLNPDNNEVNLILSNLRLGKSPFTDAKSPVDSKPEKRKSLPVKEKTTDTIKNKSGV